MEDHPYRLLYLHRDRLDLTASNCNVTIYNLASGLVALSPQTRSGSFTAYGSAPRMVAKIFGEPLLLIKHIISLLTCDKNGNVS